MLVWGCDQRVRRDMGGRGGRSRVFSYARVGHSCSLSECRTGARGRTVVVGQ